MLKYFKTFLFLLPLSIFSQEDLKYYEKYMPESSCGEIIHYSNYSVSFCENIKMSEWTIYYSTKERLLGNLPRQNNYRQDSSLKDRDANLNFYVKSGYDRGHLVPASDMRYDEIAMSESFYMTNVVPQSPAFNRGIFRKLEKRFREWVNEFDSIVIITGIIKSDIKEYINGQIRSDSPDSSFIPVPNLFYKVFFDIEENRAISFILPNGKSNSSDLLDYVVPIDSLERITGLDFFYKMPETIELLLEIDSGTRIISSNNNKDIDFIKMYRKFNFNRNNNNKKRIR